jgi:hypothetical protein
LKADSETIRWAQTIGDAVLAAVPRELSQHLNPFWLTLRLVEQGRSDIPADAARHFDDIISQVRALLQDSYSHSSPISPEVVELILEIRATEGLRNAIDSLPKLNAIPPEIAHNILSTMEQRLAFAD